MMYPQLEREHLDLRVSTKILPFASENEPYSAERAKELIRDIIARGRLAFSAHAKEEMRDDSLQAPDVLNILRAGWLAAAEMEKGTWRYRFETNRMTAVVAFRSTDHAVVVTAWRDV